MIEIRHRRTGAVLYSGDHDSARDAVVAAVAAGISLSGADLSDVDLSGADLHGVDLSDVDLSYADLSGADLSGADLHGADLSGADLHGADLSGADLSGADLHGADLHGANLSGADLHGADLSGADLSGADLLVIYGLRWTVTINHDRMTIGCESHTVAAWREFDAGWIAGMDDDAAEFWGNHGAWLLARCDAIGGDE